MRQRSPGTTEKSPLEKPAPSTLTEAAAYLRFFEERPHHLIASTTEEIKDFLKGIRERLELVQELAPRDYEISGADPLTSDDNYDDVRERINQLIEACRDRPRQSFNIINNFANDYWIDWANNVSKYQEEDLEIPDQLITKELYDVIKTLDDEHDEHPVSLWHLWRTLAEPVLDKFEPSRRSKSVRFESRVATPERLPSPTGTEQRDIGPETPDSVRVAREKHVDIRYIPAGTGSEEWKLLDQETQQSVIRGYHQTYGKGGATKSDYLQFWYSLTDSEQDTFR